MRKTICPIDLECVDYPCCNYFQCRDATISWEIPYYVVQDNTLIVKQYGWRCDWDDEAHGTLRRFCPLPSGNYKILDGNAHEYEMKSRLMKAWNDAGWYSAVPIPEAYKERDEEDDIPF